MSQRRNLILLLAGLGWMIFLLAAALVAGLLIVVGRPYSTIALVVMVGVVAIFILRQIPVQTIVQRLVTWWQATPINGFAQANRPTLTQVLMVSGVYLLVLSTQAFLPAQDDSRLPTAALLLAAGGVVLLIGFSVSNKMPALPVPGGTQVRTWAQSYKITLAIGVFLLWLVAEINGGILGIALLEAASIHLQFFLLCLGVLLVMVGLGGGLIVGGSVSWREVGFLILVTLAALILRLWRVDDAIRFFVDELSFSTAMRRIWRDPQTRLLEPMESIAAFPYLFPYLQTFGVDVFGRNLIGLRATVAALGAVGIPALYFLARTLFDRKTAVIAALLLATFPPHLQFSRIGISEIAAPLFGTLALAFLARGMAHDSRPDYAAGGALLGMTHYFHEGGRLLYTPLAVIWIAGVFILWRPRLNWRNLAVAGVALVLVAAPVYYTLAGLDRPLVARMVDNAAGLDSVYWRRLLANGDWGWHIRHHVLPPFLVYIHQLDETLFYKADTALLLPVIFPLFMLGALYALRRWRMPGMLLLVLWVVATSMGNSLMVMSAGSPRFVMAFPALMLLAAVGIRYVTPLILPQGLVSRRTFRRVMVGSVAALVLIQAGYYFAVYLPQYNHDVRIAWGTRDPQDVVLRSLNFPPGTDIHVVTDWMFPSELSVGLLRFLYPENDLDFDAVLTKNFTVDYLEKLPRDRDHAFFIAPDDSDVLETLQAHFYLMPPVFSPYADLDPQFQFVLYYAPDLPGVSQ